MRRLMAVAATLLRLITLICRTVVRCLLLLRHYLFDMPRRFCAAAMLFFSDRIYRRRYAIRLPLDDTLPDATTMAMSRHKPAALPAIATGEDADRYISRQFHQFAADGDADTP